jgi:hypothetical protein
LMTSTTWCQTQHSRYVTQVRSCEAFLCHACGTSWALYVLQVMYVLKYDAFW